MNVLLCYKKHDCLVIKEDCLRFRGPSGFDLVQTSGLSHLVPPKSTMRSPTMQQHCLLRGHGPFPLGSTFFQEEPSVVQGERDSE